MGKVSGTELYNSILALLANYTKEEAIHRICSFLSEEQYRKIILHLVETNAIESKFEESIIESEHSCACGECKGDCSCHSKDDTDNKEDVPDINECVKVGRVVSVRGVSEELQNKTVADLLYSARNDKEYETILKIAKGLNYCWTD